MLPRDTGALEAGEAEAALLRMSTLSEEGVMAVKQAACDRLLSSRVEMKMKACSAARHCGALSHGVSHVCGSKPEVRRASLKPCDSSLR